MKKILSLTISLLVVFLLALYIFKNIETFKEITKLNSLYFYPVFAFLIVLIYINGLILKELAKPFKVNLREHFRVSAATSLLNAITPLRGGAALRALYMKKIHNLKYAEFIASLFGYYIIVLLTSAVIGIFLSLLDFFLKKRFFAPTTLVFLIIALFCLIAINFKFRFKKQSKTFEILNRIIESWNKICKQKTLLKKLFTLAVINIIVITLINFFTFKGLGLQNITITESVYFSIINFVSALINITPGAIGITETLYFFSAKIIAIPPEMGILAALIIRAIAFIGLCIFGIPAYFSLSKKIKKKSFTS